MKFADSTIPPRRRIAFLCLVTSAIVLAIIPLSGRARGDAPKPTPQQLEFFEKQVRPVLVEHCYSCHSNQADSLKAGLLVDSRDGLIEGGDSGEAIVPGHPEASLLVQAVRYEAYEMPPKGKLPDQDIAALETWVKMGAPWPEETPPSERVDRPEFDLQARKREQWAWQPIRSPRLPEVNDAEWPLQDFDHFILARLEGEGLTPAADADRLAVLRRLYLDLIGLPPTAEQVEAFLNDDPEGALERVVDQLLDSPHFGERWGRHWLDLVRYAESRGHEFDNDTPNAFQYRDYIIRALNADVPYDQLIREHIAGDLLANPRLHPEQGFNESILGTGFWFLGEWVHSPVDIRKDESDRFDNMIDVMSKTFLGVTVACARCHDHKFDPISTADYYSLTGFLQGSDYRQARFESLEHNRRIADQLRELDQGYRDRLHRLLAEHGIVPPERTSSSELPIQADAVLVDYANVGDQEFLQDGFIFGDAPRQAAELEFDDQRGVSVSTFAAASNDPFWHGLESITEGKIQNRSRLDTLPKSGRTLRTPTFTLKHGDVACFVQGRGHVVASVDSHRLIFGPLHGETIVKIDDEGTWTKLNLGRYVGHRLHLEFIPAKDESLSVRMVVQGLGNDQLQKLEEHLAARDEPFQAFAAEAEALLAGSVETHRDVFADFESGTYGDWTVEGDAFGAIPQTPETIAPYQGNVNHRGAYFVNSHNIRGDLDPARRGDKATGKLISPEFTIDFQELEFLVGGGAHAGKTCVNLVVDDEVVLSATGQNNNRMAPHRWDLRRLQGQTARIEIVDQHQGGWGNIGADQFDFVRIERRPSPNATARELLDQWRRDREQLRSGVMFRSRLAPAMMDGTGEDAHVLIRGNSSNPGKLEPRHFLTAISGDEPLRIPAGSGRLELAEQINAASNPLTARVIVNRIWHHLMGRGIVATTDDFGVLGQRPTHPELLDFLAQRFVADGQSIKRMIRAIVLSRTYRMSSKADPDAVAIDPENELWHHHPPKRLEGEAIRDSLLAISGRLDPQPFGPPVPIHLTPFMDGRGRPGVNGPLDGNGRRSIYIAVRRNFLSPFMLAFDTPVPFSTMGRRNVSNVPAQALILMNDPFVVEQAERWATRVRAECDEPGERIRWMYLSAFARQPTEQELQLALQFVGDSTAEERWAELAHALINTKEFIFLR
jgi:hypothetical protein